MTNSQLIAPVLPAVTFRAPAPVATTTVAFRPPATVPAATFLAPAVPVPAAPTAAPVPAAPTVVPGLGQTGVDLTLVLPVNGPAAAVRNVVERLSEALYAQCISFEVVGVADATALATDEVNGLPLTRFVNTSVRAGAAVTSGRWVAVLDVESAAEIDAYGFVELLHQARERA
ncbi:hypothetical protein Q0Z83_061500 [Actinoplanes sichuanensis]|uniref:Glycosyl transferase family 2 n=1 Tax=Actinoplanes sichuanensis TaxID=512349 RepID=A0ABW4A0D6_9ACTN|nr:hypothetical protein [Actinoplanes sichuanensis]BEL07959.1 hypothetical protein Q0Z83_061500 [Actinoplanes sichuanensis]